jgi:NlpC/P60 family putative phage cell wall peptidase
MNLSKQDLILQEARSWLGTRWRAGQSTKGVSCDCVGLICGVGENLGFDAKPENYSQIPQGDSLIDEVGKFTNQIPSNEALPGDILVFKLFSNGNPQHLGFKSTDGKFIHADARARIRSVVEVPIGYWQDRIVAAFRIPI